MLLRRFYIQENEKGRQDMLELAQDRAHCFRSPGTSRQEDSSIENENHPRHSSYASSVGIWAFEILSSPQSATQGI